MLTTSEQWTNELNKLSNFLGDDPVDIAWLLLDEIKQGTPGSSRSCPIALKIMSLSPLSFKKKFLSVFVTPNFMEIIRVVDGVFVPVAKVQTTPAIKEFILAIDFNKIQSVFPEENEERTEE